MKLDFWLFLKGMMMGAADIVPGVSGGTIAFITGIYERLIFSIKEVPVAFIHLCKTRRLDEAWQRADGTFLLTLFSGIVLSAILLARLITYLMVNFPIPLWSFFFGLILASVWVVAKQVSKWRIAPSLTLLFGIALAWLITTATPIEWAGSYETAFASGLIAICAMILPGISGSFILVILGTYAFVLEAVKTFDVVIMATFMLGCLIGLLSIANVLSWAFKQYRDVTLALLTGFMIGALNKVWPWKEVLSYRTNSKGQQVPLLEQSVSPESFESIYGVSPDIGFAFLLAVIGMGMVLAIDHYSNNNEN